MWYILAGLLLWNVILSYLVYKHRHYVLYSIQSLYNRMERFEDKYYMLLLPKPDSSNGYKDTILVGTDTLRERLTPLYKFVEKLGYKWVTIDNKLPRWEKIKKGK